MTQKNNFNLNLPDSCCTLVPKNDVWTVPNIAAFQIAKNDALMIPDYNRRKLKRRLPNREKEKLLTPIGKNISRSMEFVSDVLTNG